MFLPCCCTRICLLFYIISANNHHHSRNEIANKRPTDSGYNCKSRMSLRVCVREFVYETCFVCVQQQKYVACGDIQQIQKLTKNNNKCNGNNNNNKIIVNAHNKTKNHSNYYYYREMLDVRRTRTTTTISPPSYHQPQPLNTPIRHCNSRL